MQIQSRFRLLVVRLGAMGDILHALPAVTALRAAHPNWLIDWVVEPRWQPLLAIEDPHGIAISCPLVDRIHLAPTKEWRKAPFSARTIAQVRALRAAMRNGRYDAVIDLQGAIRSAAIARLAGCRRVIGAAEPWERGAQHLFTEKIQTHGAHVIDQDLELACAIAGDNLTHTAPSLPLDPAAEAWADAQLAKGAPSVLINPGAGWGAKRWPVERYGEVAARLARRGCQVLINATPGEASLAHSIQGATGGAAIWLHCTLAQLISVTRRVALTIAGDTGPLHLACALGRPVVGIYGPTDPLRNGPYGVPSRVLRSQRSRRDHKRHAQPEAGLLTIEPAAVVEAAEQILCQGPNR